MNPPRHRRQSGFALLLVFAMAAIVAMMLYLELPRVAFEAQRVREEVLIERGEQYQRAIKLFFRRFQRYPPTIEALENTNNIRFLRRRYKDPMTGKDEWRLIHTGPGGIFTDSLTQKPPQKTGDKQISSLDSMASTTTTDTPVVSMLPRRRQSESAQVPMPGAPGVVPATDLQSGQLYPPPQDQPEQPPQPQPWQAGQTPGQPMQPGQPGQPGQPYPSLLPGQPGYQPSIPGFQPNPAGMIVTPGIQSGGVAGPGQSPPSNIPMSGPGQPPFAPPPYGSSSLAPTGAGPGNTPVPEIIRTILTQPGARPGGLGGGMTIGAGIAGVASTLEAEGIKSYNDHTKYNEWEFIYDPRKDISMQMMGMQPGGLPPQNVPTTQGSSMFTPSSPSTATPK
jgi:type II secretory pathway pseudopilin PulG